MEQGQEKMSKSSPDSAIFMEDTAAEVNKKIKQAFCPPQEVVGNPCIAYMGMIIFPWCGAVSVARSEANGGPKYALSQSTGCRSQPGGMQGFVATVLCMEPFAKGVMCGGLALGVASPEMLLWAALHGDKFLSLGFARPGQASQA